jgi:hypothetical protein
MSKEANKDTQVTPSAELIQTDVLLIPKQSISMFLTIELLVYVSQILIFFFVTLFISDLLRDENQLVSHLNSKVNENTLLELVAIMLAIPVTLGIICGIAKAAPETSLIQLLSDKVLAEIPRTAYFFGSSISGTVLAVGLYTQLHPHTPSPPIEFWLITAVILALVGFIYGCIFAYAFKHKTHIKVSARASSNSNSAP